MPLKNYGVLKGRPVGRTLGSGQNPHYQIHVVDNTTDYRLAVNVASALTPSELEYFIDANFQHPFLEQIAALETGWHALAAKPGGPALDFIRTNLFDPRKLVPLPFNVPGPDNDLNEKIDHYVQRALSDEEAEIYAFGERWGPEAGVKDKIFGFLPGNGVHDLHMNQANVGRFKQDDGVYQDGALLLHFPHQNQWVGIFLKFQSQTWHTDDHTGHQTQPDTSGPPSDHPAPAPAPVPGPAPVPAPVPSFPTGTIPTPEAPDGAIRIVAALANALQSPEHETVTLLNVTSAAINLAGWKLLDRDKNAQALSGTIGAGETLRVSLVPPVILPNKGGLITVLNPDGLRVDGVSYTKAAASLPGFSIKF
ncbi:hypothetical protein IGB42_01898 [Andreprevotia sp. IGB-42]|uniref:DUF2278 family protein n=1 Tax=Andreprevotia sp. IGB-42 TaxID=2497473 RepID=UPI001356A7B3|nr:DUF2278 family protein [Andreprevotia sp. IGB-42]KAF0813547.1 hypothetical protein IGB42_01898 [Andreprevotia sp. IGB-42]